MTVNTKSITVIFVTTEEQYAIPDTPVNVPSDSTDKKLNIIVKEILKASADTDRNYHKLQFDFLIDGILLRTSLQKFLDEKGVSEETKIEITYFMKYPAPEPEDSLKHDDWVTACRTRGDWILSGCYDTNLHIWSVSGEHKLIIPGHTDAPMAVEWVDMDESTATFVSVSKDQTAIKWKWNKDTNSVEKIFIYRGHAREITCCAVDSPASFMATGSWDKMLKIWPLQNDNADGPPSKKLKESSTGSDEAMLLVPLKTLQGHKDVITDMTWIAADELLTCSWDHMLIVWDPEYGTKKNEIPANKAFNAVSWSPINNLLITASTDSFVRLYDPRSHEGSLVKQTFRSHTNWVKALMWSTDKENLFISASYDKTVKLWDTRSPQVPLYNMTGHKDNVLCCDWGNPHFIVSGAEDNALKIFKSKVT